MASTTLVYASVVLLLVVLGHVAPKFTPTVANLPDDISDRIVWIPQDGPGGGGGGGGNKMKEPPRVAELPGKDKITVPVQKPPAVELQKPKDEPEQVAQVNIPAKLMTAGDEPLPGLIEAAPSGPPSLSQGSGSGGGAGTGTGSGIGSGTGSGLGPGYGGGTGGGIYQPGSVDKPLRVTREVKPAYTPDAMRARLQGVATVECVVSVDGRPGDCHVTRSLDPTFGLDQEAIKAATQWRFAPSTYRGMPVQVRVSIEMSFILH